MKTPWHLWLVGIAALLWNAGGAVDYTLTQLDVPAYTDAMPDAIRAHLQGYPAWMTAIWALAVWTPLLAALALLLRRRAAAPLFLAALAFVLVAGLWNYAISTPTLSQVAGPGVFWFWVVVCAAAVLQWLYARAMAARGVLR